MKISVEKRKANIDGKEFEYNAFCLKLNCGEKLGDYTINLKIATKQEKDLLLQLLEYARFELVEKVSNNGTSYMVPMIRIDAASVDIDIKPIIQPDTLMLIRLVLNQ